MPGQYSGRVYGPVMPNVDPYHPRETQYAPQDAPRDIVPQQLTPQQQQPPSPGRKSLFDYVSPFDALASTSAVKKKDVGYASAESRDTEDSWTPLTTSVDPKRKSVENLMDQLARSQGPVQATHQSLDPYGVEPDTPPNEPAQLPSRVPPPPLPPKPLQGQGSPRASPPHTFAQRPLQVRSGDSPLLQSGGSKPSQGGVGPSAKERAGSPLARGNWKAQDNKQRAPRAKPFINPK